MARSKTIYKHIGYFNNRADISTMCRIISKKDRTFSVDRQTIFDYVDNGFGSFHESDDDTDDILIVEEENIDGLVISNDKKYIATYDICYDDAAYMCSGNDEEDLSEYDCNSYIDIYVFDRVESPFEYEEMRKECEDDDTFVVRLSDTSETEYTSSFFFTQKDYEDAFDRAYRTLVLAFGNPNIKYLDFISTKTRTLFKM